MRSFVKHALLLLCLLVPCSLAEDEIVSVGLQSVSFNYMDLDNGFHPILKGTMIAFTIKAAGNCEIEASNNMQVNRFGKPGPEFYSQDLKGRDLGELRSVSDKVHRWTVDRSLCMICKEFDYYFTFSRLPSIGSEGLNLSGGVPICLFSCKTDSPVQPLQIRNGAQLFLGDLTLTVDILNQEEKDKDFEAGFQFFSPNRAMKIINMVFYDKSGYRLLDYRGNPGYSWRGGKSIIEPGKKSGYAVYSFKHSPDLLNISVNYWGKIEERDVPVFRKVLFYHPDEEDAGQQQR